MSTEVVVALIAGVFVVVQVMLAHYLSNVRSSNRLRTSIVDNIEILRKMVRDHPTALLLDHHVANSIRLLIKQEEDRARHANFVLAVKAAGVSSVLCFALIVIYDSADVSPRIQELLEFAILGVLLAALYYLGGAMFMLAVIWKTRRRPKPRDEVEAAASDTETDEGPQPPTSRC